MQQWEYCELYCDVENTESERYNERTMRMESCDAWRIHCDITYFTESSSDYLVCNDRNELLKEYNNLFYKAMRLLGEAGWELVSVQHGNETVYTYSGNRGSDYMERIRHNTLLYGNKIAYFKRPKVEGRKFDVNEINI